MEEDHSSLSVASSGVTVAVSCSHSPFLRLSSVLLMVMPSVGTVTVTSQLAFLLPIWAVTMAFPMLMAVTFPSETTTTSSLEEIQVTGSATPAGVTVAVSWTVSPLAMSSVVLSRVTDSARGPTVTRQTAVLVPALAVIIAWPSLRALTSPLWDNSTTLGFEFSHERTSVVFSGSTVAVRRRPSP